MERKTEAFETENTLVNKKNSNDDDELTILDILPIFCCCCLYLYMLFKLIMSQQTLFTLQNLFKMGDEVNEETLITEYITIFF